MGVVCVQQTANGIAALMMMHFQPCLSGSRSYHLSLKAFHAARVSTRFMAGAAGSSPAGGHAATCVKVFVVLWLNFDFVAGAAGSSPAGGDAAASVNVLVVLWVTTDSTAGAAGGGPVRDHATACLRVFLVLWVHTDYMAGAAGGGPARGHAARAEVGSACGASSAIPTSLLPIPQRPACSHLPAARLPVRPGPDPHLHHPGAILPHLWIDLLYQRECIHKQKSVHDMVPFPACNPGLRGFPTRPAKTGACDAYKPLKL